MTGFSAAWGSANGSGSLLTASLRWRLTSQGAAGGAREVLVVRKIAPRRLGDAMYYVSPW